jgi:ribose 5-phosphate isomerase B
MIFRGTMKKLLIGCDHAGLEFKEHLMNAIPELPWEDVGTYSKETVDYPDIADKLCPLIKSPDSVGILICGSGQGMAIRANRFSHIRAALCWNEDTARLARAHNDANVLCLGARTMDPVAAERVLLTFLDVPFEEGRHRARVEKLWSVPC